MSRAALALPLLAAGFVATFAGAQAPERSLRPEPRQGTGTQSVAPAPAPAPVSRTTANAPRNSLRPEARGSSKKKPANSTTAPTASAAAGIAAAPAAKPEKKAKKEKSGGLFAKRKLRKTSVCGDIALQGEQIGNVPGPGVCGVPNAVRLTSVSGVALSQSAVMDCDTAQALKTWVEDGLIPAFRRRGTVVQMKVAAHYACRTRNNQPGAKISEHGKGKAIDISAFTMKDGKVYTVQESWWRGRAKKPLRQAYEKACGPFGTTLGPNSDRYHKDHFHFDTARYRSGPYCK